MKRTLAILLSIVMLSALLVGCGNPNSASSSDPSTSSDPTANNEVIKLKIGTMAPESSSFVTNSKIFADKLDELSGGTIQCEIVAAGALGNAPQHFAQLNDGTLDIFVQGVDAPAAVKGGEDFGIFNVPFLFDDTEHFHAFLKSDVFAGMMEKVREHNQFSFLGLIGDRPARSLSTSGTEVRTPDDMKGLLLRVPESAVPMAVFQAWGANTTTCAASAIFEGLQSGQFDGQENGIDSMVIDGYMEVQNVYMVFEHTQQGIGAYISDATVAKLSDKQMGWVNEALSYTLETTSATLWDVNVPEYYAAMEEKGITIVKDVDIGAFRAIVDEMIPEFEGQYFSAGLYDQIRALA